MLLKFQLMEPIIVCNILFIFNKPLQPGVRALLNNRGQLSRPVYKIQTIQKSCSESYITILVHMNREQYNILYACARKQTTSPAQKFKLRVRAHSEDIRCTQRVIVTTPFNKTISVVLLLDFYFFFIKSYFVR